MKHRVFTTIFLLMTVNTVMAQGQWLTQVEGTLQSQLEPQLDKMANEMGLLEFSSKVVISYLDRRLNLTPCTQPLNLSSPSPMDLGRQHIKIQCGAPKPWALNVPVTLNLYTNVVSTNQPVPRGITLRDQHLDYKWQNLADLRNGYFIKKEQVIGKQSKRALSGQTIVSEHLILPALMVRKGDRVMIMAKKGAMNVKMPGEALNNGREGRQIRVKNVRSQRIVKGKVVAPGLVLVNF